MTCNKCQEGNKCFFHLTKEIVLNNEIKVIKEWIMNLYINYKFATRSFIINLNNPDKKSFYNLLTSTYPRLSKYINSANFDEQFVPNINEKFIIWCTFPRDDTTIGT